MFLGGHHEDDERRMVERSGIWSNRCVCTIRCVCEQYFRKHRAVGSLGRLVFEDMGFLSCSLFSILEY